MKEPMTKKRIKKHHYLPTREGGIVCKSRDDLTAVEQEFVRSTKDLIGANQGELDAYAAATQKMFADPQ